MLSLRTRALQDAFKINRARRNAMTAISPSRSSHLCLSWYHLSSSVPECTQRPLWGEMRVPQKLCICLYFECPSQERMKLLCDPDGVRISSQFFSKDQWKKRKFKTHPRPGRTSSGFLLQRRLSKRGGYPEVGQLYCN